MGTHADADADPNVDGGDDLDTPKFRGCLVCYSAEWAYYGAKKGIRSVRD